MIPSNCRYSATHEWVMLDGTTATVGITDHAQDALGDITFVELPRDGSTVAKGKECGVIESVKAASDLFSPVSGTVTESNRSLATSPQNINTDPHGNGWLFKVSGVTKAEFDGLMDATAYGAHVESEK